MDSGNLSNIVVRLQPVIDVLARLRYDAVGVGEVDLRVCGDKFFEEAAKNKLTILDARPNAPESTLPFIVKNVGGVRVGIVSFGATLPEDTGSEYERRKSFYGAYKAAREASNLLIVLDQGNIITSDWLQRNAKRLGKPDIVIAGRQKIGLTQPEVFGKTYIVPTSFQAVRVGVVDIEIDRGADPRLTWSQVELDEKIALDEKTKNDIQAFMFKSTVGVVHQQAALSESAPEMAAGIQSVPNTPPPDGKPYYRSNLCKACHAKEYDDWSRTKHASATKTLADADRLLPECLECHSEQYRRLKGVTVANRNMGGIECATCHMNSLPHGLERKTVMAKTKVSALDCLECHTKDRSPAYDEQVYFPRISHMSAVGSKSASASSANTQ